MLDAWILARDPELAIRLGEPKLGEEHAGELLVVVLAGVEENLLVSLPQPPGDGCGLDNDGGFREKAQHGVEHLAGRDHVIEADRRVHA